VGRRLKAFKAITPGILPPRSVVFALLVAFLANQVWGEADKASTAVNREASAYAPWFAFPSFPVRRRRTCVGHPRLHPGRRRSGMAWLARHHVTLTIAPPKLAEALRLALSLTPQQVGQVTPSEMVARSRTPSMPAASASSSVDHRSTGSNGPCC
jgi:hypothetical protein